ncbi:MAG: sulfurtransferase [Pyrinomonadaceae bacterium]
MKKAICGMFFVMLAPTLAVHANVRDSMIVSTEWLSKHLNDSNLVLLQVGEKDEYVASHIAGAQFIALADISTPRGEGLTLELPPVAQLRTTFGKLGVSDHSRIIVYFSKDWVTPTARVFMTLDHLGLGDRTSILNGGLPAWRAEGREVTSQIRVPKFGHLTLEPRNIVVDADSVKTNLNNPSIKILDARAPQFYTGAEVARMPRGGHIPNAKNIPFSSLVDETNKFKSAGALTELFSTASVKPGNSVVTYCHIGQQASLLYFVARYLGYDARVYDGSFEDWSRRSDLPVEK